MNKGKHRMGLLASLRDRHARMRARRIQARRRAVVSAREARLAKIMREIAR